MPTGAVTGYRGSIEDRFWAKVNKDGPIMPMMATPCWVWTSTCNDKGYPQLWISPRNRYAHRFSFEWHYGPIHRRWDIDHICFNHPCVRPDHLRPATRKQNMENLSGLLRSNKSGARGVWWDSARQRWNTQVSHHGRRYCPGRFDTLAEAEAAVLAKRLELFTHNQIDRKDVAGCQ